jgi:aminopeptidase 2
MSRSG